MFNMQLVGEEAEIVVKVVNQGIDSRLEGFTKSTFGWYSHTTSGEEIPYHKTADNNIIKRIVAYKLHCQVAEGEMSILLRRLLEMWDIKDYLEAGQLADDIMQAKWGLESRDA